MDAIAPLRVGTRQRILDAAETLLVEEGASGLSLRRVTGLADVNLAAVNYYFGSKRGLLHAVLTRELDPIHEDRLRLLDACERRWPDAMLSPARILAALFAPAIARARSHPGLLRFLGRVYTDGEGEIASFLAERYERTNSRFFAAFAAALPGLKPAELALRLRFVTVAAASIIAGADASGSVAGLGTLTDEGMLARLTALMAGALTAPGTDAPDASYDELLAGVDIDEDVGVGGDGR